MADRKEQTLLCSMQSAVQSRKGCKKKDKHEQRQGGLEEQIQSQKTEGKKTTENSV
jgi:hypothetical protein